MPFKKGQSGNPAGRPPVLRERQKKVKELLHDRAPEIVAKAVDMAIEGDTVALRICMDRLIGPVKSEDITDQVKLEFTMSMIRKLGRFIQENHPQQAESFLEILEPFGDQIVKELE